MMEAQAYVDERGKAVEDWLTAFIEQQFGRVVDGLLTYKSQFGIEYQQVSVFLDSRDDHAAMMHRLTATVHQMLPPSDERLAMTLVWRIRPLVSASPNPPEHLIRAGTPEGHNPFRVKVRFRFHTMPGTDAKDPITEPDPRSSAGHGDG
jgi:hypothetical protein